MKRKNGHWVVPLIVGALIIGLLSRVARTIVVDMTLTVRSFGTLLAVAGTAGYIWYSRKKAG